MTRSMLVLMKQFIACKAVIRNDEGNVLMLRESPQNPVGVHVGKLDFPGGRVEIGERWDKALRREVFEETKLEIVIGKPVAVSEWRPIVKGEEWQIIGIFFLCSLKERNEIVLSEDHSEFVWVKPSEYKKHPVMPSLVSVFEELNRL